MPPHKELEALIRAAARYFRVKEDQLRAPGGRYLPLVKFRQVTQLVAIEKGHKPYQIAKAFDYANSEGTLVKRNVASARNHLYHEHQWWFDTKAELVDEWDAELARTD